MSPYHSFTGAQRDRAQRWLNREWASGRLARPTRCVACGQPEGVTDAHAEDYSEPFAAGKPDAYHLCFPCHIMVHCRARRPETWREYRATVESGYRTEPFRKRDWPKFQKILRRGAAHPVAWLRGPRPKRLVLREIELPQNAWSFLGESP